MSTNIRKEKSSSFLAKLGISEDKVHKETLNTGDSPGPTYLSAHPDFESAIQPHMVTVDNLDDIKQLVGIADELYKKSVMEEHHDIPESWSEDTVAADMLDLSEEKRRKGGAETKHER